jgi:hypothetical protein
VQPNSIPKVAFIDVTEGQIEGMRLDHNGKWLPPPGDYWLNNQIRIHIPAMHDIQKLFMWY